jgi:hypothetical protein
MLRSPLPQTIVRFLPSLLIGDVRGVKQSTDPVIRRSPVVTDASKAATSANIQKFSEDAQIVTTSSLNVTMRSQAVANAANMAKSANMQKEYQKVVWGIGV